MESDRSFLEAARKLNKEALAKIFDLYAPALYSYALRMCGDPLLADHIVGDVFAKLLDQLAAGNGPKSNLRAYLFEITYHLIVDEARYSQRRAPLEAVDVFPSTEYSAATNLEDRILFDKILQVIQNDLTVQQRHVIVLRFLEGLSVRETAAIIGKTDDNVKVSQNRAIAALRKALVRNGWGRRQPMPSITGNRRAVESRMA